MNKIEKFAIPVLCVTMGLVFLYFGFQQIYSPDNWATFVPDFLSIGAMTLNNWVMLNGVLELTLGLFLIMGLYTRFSALILSLHLLFIAFSIGNWATFVPDFLSIGAMTLNNWVMLNGVLELTLGLFLIMGLYTRFSALILSLHLLFIAFSIGFNPLGVRDFGLAIATFVIFLSGAHPYGIDAKVSNKSSHSGQTPSVQ
jgi:uncharacterized membrane protein YphA (DoxX/SURF4 family)